MFVRPPCSGHFSHFCSLLAFALNTPQCLTDSLCFCSDHFTDFVLLQLDKEGLATNIGPASLLAVMYSLPLAYSVGLLAVFAWAVGGFFRKGTRVTCFQLLACGCLAFLRMTDVSLRLGPAFLSSLLPPPLFFHSFFVIIFSFSVLPSPTGLSISI